MKNKIKIVEMRPMSRKTVSKPQSIVASSGTIFLHSHVYPLLCNTDGAHHLSSYRRRSHSSFFLFTVVSDSANLCLSVLSGTVRRYVCACAERKVRRAGDSNHGP